MIKSICLSLNFIVFPKIYDITTALLKSEIDGAFVDSFIITAHLNLIRNHPGPVSYTHLTLPTSDLV